MERNGHPPRVPTSDAQNVFAPSHARSRWPSLILFSLGVMATTATRDFPLLLCRIGFVLALAGVAAVWGRLSADDRFYAIIIALAGSLALGLSASFNAFCSTLTVFGCVTIGFAFFTLATGYSVGWQRVRVVENASGVAPLIFGLLLVVIALGAKRLVRRT